MANYDYGAIYTANLYGNTVSPLVFVEGIVIENGNINFPITNFSNLTCLNGSIYEQEEFLRLGAFDVLRGNTNPHNVPLHSHTNSIELLNLNGNKYGLSATITNLHYNTSTQEYYFDSDTYIDNVIISQYTDNNGYNETGYSIIPAWHRTEEFLREPDTACVYLMQSMDGFGNTYYSICIGFYTEYNTIYVSPYAVNMEGGSEGTGVRPASELILRNLDGSRVGISVFDKSYQDSGTGGGNGDYGNGSDTIDFPGLPTMSPISSGIVTLYKASEQQLADLSSWLYSSSILDTLSKWWSNPLTAIVSIGIVPIDVLTGGLHSVKFAGIQTDVYMYIVNNQFVTIDCGMLNVSEYYADFSDYIATKISIYLPFVGVRHLQTSEIMGGQVHVKYNVDLITGTFIAYIKCIRGNLESVLYQFEGNLLSTVPISARDWTQTYTSIVKAIPSALSPSSGGALSSIVDVVTSRPDTQRTGSFSGTGALLSIKKPFLIIERPIKSIPENFNKLKGYTSNITYTLSSLKGFTKVDSIVENNINCTSDELNEIEELLKEGIFL